MTWGHAYLELACGCDGNVTPGAFDDLWVGAFQLCRKHGDTTVRRMSRVMETSGSRDMKLGVKGVDSGNDEEDEQAAGAAGPSL